MTTYYINADSGDDGSGDGSSGNPWETLATAITNSSTDDTIVCQDATAAYTFSTQSITDRIIQAVTVGDAVFDGAAAQVKWTLTGTVNLERLVFQNAIGVTGSTDPIFAISTATNTTLTITECKFNTLQVSNTLQLGGLISPNGNNSRTHAVNIDNCLFDDITKTSAASSSYASIFGARDQGGGTAFTITNCTIYLETSAAANLMPHIFTNGQSSSTYATLISKNNIYRNNTGTTVNYRSTAGGATAFLSATLNNNCWNNITGEPSGTNDITGDPLFVDEDNGDFNLRPTSPCIGTGTLI